MKNPNCFECVYKGRVPGSEHIRCEHPAVPEVNALTEVLGTLASVGRTPPFSLACEKLKIEGDAAGIRRGWFIWPMNFDPTWLRNCEGFKAKGKP